MADADLLAGATQELLVERPAPPSRQPRSVLFLAGSLIGANAVSLGLRFVSGWLQLFLVKDPEVLGTFKLFGIALGYVPFFQGGVFHGLNRELPYYVGKGDRRRVEELAASAQAWALALSAIAALVFLALAGWNLLRGQLWPATGWATCAACSFTLFYNTSYLQATFRTGHDFTRLALVNVVQSTLTVALLVLVYLWSFYGLCLRLMIADLVAMGLLYYWRPVRVGPKLDLGCLKHLLVIGAPIFVAAQLYGYWATTLDSQFVVSFFGRKGLGDYYPATQVCQSLRIPPPGHHAGDLSADGRTVRPHRQPQGPHSHDRQTHAGARGADDSPGRGGLVAAPPHRDPLRRTITSPARGPRNGPCCRPWCSPSPPSTKSSWWPSGKGCTRWPSCWAWAPIPAPCGGSSTTAMAWRPSRKPCSWGESSSF